MTDSLKSIVIVGAGGHAKVVIDCVKKQGLYEIIALVDETQEDGEWREYRILKQPPEADINYFIVAIGDNKVRQKKFQQMIERGFKPATICHPSAVIAEDAVIGEGTVLCAGAIVCPGSVVGKNCLINTAASVDHDCRIGDHVHVAPGCRLSGEVIIGEGSFLGISTTVIPKTKVGEWVVTGAGAVVIADIESHATMVGVPAKKLVKRN